MPLGLPDPNQNQPIPGPGPDAGAGLLPMLLSALAGAGFEKIASGIHKIAQSGTDPMQFLAAPELKILAVGAGLSELPIDLIGQILKAMSPSQSQQAQKPQIPINALLPALTGRLGPGRIGLQAGQIPMPQGPVSPPTVGIPPPPTLAAI